MSETFAVVTAVAPETRAVLRTLQRPTRIAVPGFRAWRGAMGTRSVTLVQSGIGPARARAALAALDGTYALVVSAGFAGALAPAAAAGDVALPTTVVWETSAGLERYAIPVDAWRAARDALPARLAARALHGPILSSPAVVASVADKRQAAARSGATAVEMEAAGVIAAARERAVGVLVLRIILDAADVSLEGLPPDLDSSWRARARLVGLPAVWPRVLALARHVPHASSTLGESLATVIATL